MDDDEESKVAYRRDIGLTAVAGAMREIDLREHAPSQPLILSTAERDALLARRDLDITIEPVAGAADQYTLTPGSTVGAVEIDGLSLRITPKIGIPQLLSLACYAIGHVRFETTEVDFPEQWALPDALALAFGAAARRALSRGLLHGYRTEENALQAVRGRIRFDDQIRRRFAVPLPVEVRYDEFTDDILLNRLVKAATHRLGRMRLRSRQARGAVAWIAESLAGVSLVAFPPRAVPEVRFDRLNEHYRDVVTLARLILRHGAFEADRGPIRASGFLMDMNQVFQEFVTVAVRDALGVSEHLFGECSIGSLDKEGRVRLTPDLTWREGSRWMFVGDVKYKKIDGGIPNADLYQLLAYATAVDLPGGLLIYAKSEREPATHTVRHSGKRLEVAALDLSGDLEGTLAQIRDLAQRITGLRRAA
ncbi:MAG: restriction endonuclease [Acidobacteria bacterium]|nr:restriction endonuclease [Acidobacteriota bacterium]